MAINAKFGIGKFKPDVLQCCASVKLFAVFYSLSGLMTSTLNIYMASQITTLERQFGFTSTQSGLLLGCNDIGYLTITLFVSYFAEIVHVPRTLSFSTVVFGLSGIICSIPYFVNPNFSSLNVDKLTTNASILQNPLFSSIKSSGQLCKEFVSLNDSLVQCANGNKDTFSVGAASTFTPVAMAIIAIGMIIQGIAKAPRQSFITIYIDNNIDKTRTAVYLGGIFSVSILGPAIGFGLGGFFSQIYVTLEDVKISPRDPRWVGAWWLGFVTFGVGGIVAGIPVMCFPRRFREKPKHTESEIKSKPAHLVKDFCGAITGLFRNKLFMVILVARCVGLLSVSGGVAFGPKYIETQFTLPAWKSNLLIGAVRVASVALGSFVGGYITSKRKLSPLSCGKLITILSSMSLAYYIITMFVGCKTPKIIGFNKNMGNLSEQCHARCDCSNDNYFPVCGSDNQNYYSPCHAGCSARSHEGFANCTCIADTGSAVPGLCSSDCSALIPYMVITVIFSLLESFAIMPGFIYMIRSVKEKEKGIAVAVAAFSTSLIGWFLGPVIFGEVIDICCNIWSSRCGVQGACSLYNNVKFRQGIHGLSLGIKCITVILDIIAYLIARRKTDWPVDKNEQKGSKHEVPEGDRMLSKPEDNDFEQEYVKQLLHDQALPLVNIKETDILD